MAAGDHHRRRQAHQQRIGARVRQARRDTGITASTATAGQNSTASSGRMRPIRAGISATIEPTPSSQPRVGSR
jgi:putative intracellular protease/amidase